MEQVSKYKKPAVDLIAKYFGQGTAEIYTQFFYDSTDKTIIKSLHEILVDYIGEKKANDEISKLTAGLNL